jgi:hypothetical protein
MSGHQLSRLRIALPLRLRRDLEEYARRMSNKTNKYIALNTVLVAVFEDFIEREKLKSKK